ncbi:hypothetical protein H4R34_001979 [Dimargaris verticillata]|uniref:RING-type E3 ubiquitin transferase n=1 Tax=Dimargaris verticillata TaxID=2761393 RepID=A0A9W8EEH6_9FUNG|nr:hypothetical protein H4R34_001979 [Dimargaris verticillata]
MAPSWKTAEPTAGDPSSPDLPPPCSTTTERCAICLASPTDPAYIRGCYHKFCFACILQWCDVDARCPLCKQPVRLLIHDIQGTFHQTYAVPEPQATAHAINAHSTSLVTSAAGRPRARRDPQWGQTLAWDRGFDKRRVVYAFNLVPVRLAGQSTMHRSRQFSLAAHPNPTKVRDWIARDLQVLLGSADITVVYEYTLALLQPPIDLLSPALIDALRPFLHEHTQHFCQELQAFAGSALDIRSYDRYVAYRSEAADSSHNQLENA